MKGFTLIELLVVVLIIGILSAVALPQYQKAVDKSRLATFIPLARTLKDASEAYYMANGNYPSLLADLDVDYPSSCSAAGSDGTYIICKGWMIDLHDGGNTNVIAIKKRLGSVNELAYTYYFDNESSAPGRIQCVGYQTIGKQLCRSICGADKCWVK
ncbi:MAG: type IV pilin protein [Candidatus Avelusimicrobium sp.]|uniref:type IV pilin protein n=1 Tax=Candidatus Avelusimicrobium sp. TaxID=3048833 RepID=UPI003F0D0537